MNRRFRLIDIRTPWLWLVVFCRKQYGEPLIEISLYRERTSKWWIYAFQWEDEPDRQGQAEAFSLPSANDVEMDAINSAIRREWNTAQEDKAWADL